MCDDWITSSDLTCDLTGVMPNVVQTAIDAAVQWLDDVTCGQYGGVCTTEIRPVIECGHRNICGCGSRWEKLDLLEWVSGPIVEITDVTVNGATVTDDYWTLVNHRWLTALDPDDSTPTPLLPWPYQNMRRLTGEGVWSVTVEHGQNPPAPLRMAAAELACQLLQRMLGRDCDLPDNATSVSRQGVTVSLQARTEGKIGLPTVDAVIETYGCIGKRGRASRLVDPNRRGAGLTRI
jgi:hypothetical protein